MKGSQSCNTLQAIRQHRLGSRESWAVKTLSSSALSQASWPPQSKSHRIRPEGFLGCRGGSFQGDVGAEVKGMWRWAVVGNLIKTTPLNGVYLWICMKSWMRPPSTRQRRRWGKLVSCCIHYSLSPIPPPRYIPWRKPPTLPHPTSMGLGGMNGALWCVSVTAVNVFTSIWSVGEAANWVSVFPGHQEVSLSINTESQRRLLQMLFPTRFQVGSDPLQAVDVIYCV